MAHDLLAPVQATPCFGIYADYDGNAPDTATLALCATRELADDVVVKLNRNPRACGAAFVDGWEHAKRYAVRDELVPYAERHSRIWRTIGEALEALDTSEEELAEEEEDGDEG